MWINTTQAFIRKAESMLENPPPKIRPRQQLAEGLGQYCGVIAHWSSVNLNNLKNTSLTDQQGARPQNWCWFHLFKEMIRAKMSPLPLPRQKVSLISTGDLIKTRSRHDLCERFKKKEQSSTQNYLNVSSCPCAVSAFGNLCFSFFFLVLVHTFVYRGLWLKVLNIPMTRWRQVRNCFDFWKYSWVEQLARICWILSRNRE